MDNAQSDETEMLIKLAAEIVFAHLSDNRVQVEAEPALIANVHQALGGLGAPAQVEEARPDPAVSIRS